MRRVVVLCLTFCAPLAGAAQQGLPPITISPAPQELPTTSIQLFPPVDGRPFIVKLPEAVAADNCIVVGTQSHTSPGPGQQIFHRWSDSRTIEIQTGKTARAIKVVIWCRGYRAELLNVPSLEQSDYQAALSPTPLRSLRVVGRIEAVEGLTVAGRELLVSHDSQWTCALFGGSECFYAIYRVASAQISQDGSFAFEVPDILSDRVLRQFGYPGHFTFTVSAPGPPFTFRLAPELSAAFSYPDPIVLRILK